MKKCRRCSIEPVVHPRGKYCKKCKPVIRKETTERFLVNHPNKNKEYRERYEKKNRARIRKEKCEYARKYRAEHKEQISETDRRRYVKHREEVLKRALKHRNVNRAQLNRKQNEDARNKGRVTPKAGYIYLVMIDEVLNGSSYYKIGHATRVEKRLMDVSKYTPWTISLLHIIKTDDMGMLESDLHHKYREFRMNGEWFRLSPAAVSEILAMN